MLYASPRPSRVWSDRRILILVALSTLIVSVIWRIPEEATYIGERVGELLFALTLSRLGPERVGENARESTR